METLEINEQSPQLSSVKFTRVEISEINVWWLHLKLVKFTRDEIESLAGDAVESMEIGEGTDKRIEHHRNVEDSRPPLVVAGPIGSPYPEDLYIPIMQS